MNTQSNHIEQEMHQALLQVRGSDIRIQQRILQRLKNEMISRSEEFRLSEERRSYLIHQLNNVRDIDSLQGLLSEMNLAQTSGPEGIMLSNQSLLI
jgi:site-specific recombinase XerC